jgi:hypothetical protein
MAENKKSEKPALKEAILKGDFCRKYHQKLILLKGGFKPVIF